MVSFYPKQTAYDFSHQIFEKAIIVRDCDVVLRGGERSSFYIDFKSSAMQHPEILTLVNYELYRQLTMMFNARPIQLVGKGLSGAILVSSLLSFAHSVFTGILIRSEVKKHGYVSPVVGEVQLDAPLVIIDDVITTGGTIKEIMEYLPKKPDCVFVVVDRKGIDNVEGVPVYSLFHVNEEVRDVAA